MSLIKILLRVYGSIGITEKKPLFYYNYPFYTATRSYFAKLKKKTNLVRRTRKPPTFPACVKAERNKSVLIPSDLD